VKILLIQTLSYLFASGGAHKANRSLIEGLAERGHECCVISPLELEARFDDYSFNPDDLHALMLNQLAGYKVELITADDPT